MIITCATHIAASVRCSTRSGVVAKRRTDHQFPVEIYGHRSSETAGGLRHAHTRTVALAMAIGVLLLAVGSYLGGKDHGIGVVVTDAIKSAVEHALGVLATPPGAPPPRPTMAAS
jgi:hypothetical protein